MRSRFILSCTLFAAILGMTLSATGQEDTPPPGAITLLPGYTHKALQGIDSRPGMISGENGLQINYDIGAVVAPGAPRFGGSFSDRAKAVPAEQRHWYKEQVVAGQPVHLVLTKGKVLMASYPKAGINFSAEIKSSEQLTDALLIILSYPAAPAASGDGR